MSSTIRYFCFIKTFMNQPRPCEWNYPAQLPQQPWNRQLKSAKLKRRIKPTVHSGQLNGATRGLAPFVIFFRHQCRNVETRPNLHGVQLAVCSIEVTALDVCLDDYNGCGTQEALTLHQSLNAALRHSAAMYAECKIQSQYQSLHSHRSLTKDPTRYSISQLNKPTGTG